MKKLPVSKLIENQSFTRTAENVVFNGELIAKISVKVSFEYSDQYSANVFRIIGTIGDVSYISLDYVVAAFPELEPFIKWYMTSSKEPLHYISNTLFWSEQSELEKARGVAVWPNATLEQLQDKEQLYARLPALMHEFKRDMESLGFDY